MMSKVFVVFAIVSVATMGSVVLADDQCGGDDIGTSGDFDFYVFAQSWSAAFCESKDFPGCDNPTDYQKTNLTIHGMWPNYNSQQDGSWWPQCCDSDYGNNVNGTVIKALLKPLQHYWPCEQDPSGDKLSKTIWAHEWNKHGTCSGLDQQPYFEAGLALAQVIGTPSEITANVGGSVKLSDLFDYYGADNCQDGDACEVAFTCDSDNNLSAVTTCWTKTSPPQQIKCPAETVGSWSCDDTVNILSFDQREYNRAAKYIATA